MHCTLKLLRFLNILGTWKQYRATHVNELHVVILQCTPVSKHLSKIHILIFQWKCFKFSFLICYSNGVQFMCSNYYLCGHSPLAGNIKRNPFALCSVYHWGLYVPSYLGPTYHYSLFIWIAICSVPGNMISDIVSVYISRLFSPAYFRFLKITLLFGSR